jgi:aryl-alcohol dehydrogenase-like predicted oxidoreductase
LSPPATQWLLTFATFLCVFEMGVQELLGVLRGIADSLGVAIAEVVVRWTLDQDGVSACIIGTSI